MAIITLFILLLQAVQRATASSYALYSDSNCSIVLQNVAANNAYPSGSCTNFKQQAGSTFKSFMFLTLDAGCGITVYEPDTNSLSCSGQAFLGSLNTCYNSSWEYYSVDECTVPTLLAATLSATASSTTATASTSATASASSHGGSLSLSAGAVVGIVLGCTVGTACILVAVFMILRRRGSRPVEGSLRPLQEEPGTQPMGDKTALGYSVQSTPTAGQRTTANANWHEVSEQGLAEVPYDNYFPVSRNAELSAEPARPGELPAQRYH